MKLFINTQKTHKQKYSHKATPSVSNYFKSINIQLITNGTLKSISHPTSLPTNPETALLNSVQRADKTSLTNIYTNPGSHADYAWSVRHKTKHQSQRFGSNVHVCQQIMLLAYGSSDRTHTIPFHDDRVRWQKHVSRPDRPELSRFCGLRRKIGMRKLIIFMTLRIQYGLEKIAYRWKLIYEYEWYRCEQPLFIIYISWPSDLSNRIKWINRDRSRISLSHPRACGCKLRRFVWMMSKAMREEDLTWFYFKAKIHTNQLSLQQFIGMLREVAKPTNYANAIESVCASTFCMAAIGSVWVLISPMARRSSDTFNWYVRNAEPALVANCAVAVNVAHRNNEAKPHTER